MDRTLARSGAPIDSRTDAGWPTGEWWRRFRSPELDHIVEDALANNQSLKKATEVLREAEAFSQVEGARLLPFLSADAGMRQSRIPTHGVVTSYNSALAGLEKTMAYVNPLSVHYEFDFWGKNRAILNASLGEAAAQAAETAEVRLLLTTAVARAYFRIRALARQAEITSEMVKLRRDLLALAQTRFRTGIDSADGVTQASAELFGFRLVKQDASANEKRSSAACNAGGEGGIRTPDTLSGMPVFKTGAINRSATSPRSAGPL